MNGPTVSVARRWRPEALTELAQDCDDAARRLRDHVEAAVSDADRSSEYWTGAAADAARQRAWRIAADTAAIAHRLVMASVAARDGADQMCAARDALLSLADDARRDGFEVADDGTVTVGADPAPLLVLLAGGQEGLAEDLLDRRAAQLSTHIRDALGRLGAADADAAHDVTAALHMTVVDEPDEPAATVPAGAWPVHAVDVVDAWPVMSQDRIAAQIAAMTSEQRDRLIAEFPDRVGNTDGVPWEMRVAANRRNVAAAILAETGADEGSRRRIAFYRSLLGEVDDPAG
ncbi:alpha/beta hydrolase, partial [Mycobacterium sp. ITM-2017-0098]